jgi:octaprenyl-diphosphate synthase
LGAIVANADTATEDKLGDFAWNLGMAFQLVDDLLDFTAREQTLGKPVGGDLKEGKVTLPLVYALERCSSAERARIETVLRERNYSTVPFKEVYGIVERGGGIERVRERANHFTEKSRQIIGEFPESPYQRALYAVTELVIERDH